MSHVARPSRPPAPSDESADVEGATTALPPGSADRPDVDPVVRAASAVVGGPPGRYAAPGPGVLGPPLLCLGVVVAMVGAVLTRAHCRTTGWASPDQLVHACYSDVATRVASSTVADQPPGAAVVTAALLRAVGGAQPRPVVVFDAAAVACTVAAVVAVLALLALLRPRGRDGAVVAASALALSPVVVVSGLVSLELLAVAGVALGLLARSRGRHALAGAVLALAASVDPLAAVVAAALWLVALAGPDRRRRLRAEVVPGLLGAAAATAAVVGAWALAGLPGLPGPLVWVPDWGPRAGYGSVWLVPALPGSTGALPGWVVVAGAVAGTVATAAVVVVLARDRARDRARSGAAGDVLGGAARAGGADPGPALALLAVAGVAVTAPALPVQSSLLLLPLVVACALPWRVHLPWAVVEVVAATTTWLYLYGQQVPARGADPWVYAVVLLARLAAVLALAVAAVRADARRLRAAPSPGALSAPPPGATAPAVPAPR